MPCARANTRAKPGSGGRHQHVGGPAGCGQRALSTVPPICRKTCGVVVERVHRCVRVPVEQQVRRIAVGLLERLPPVGLPQRGRSDQNPGFPSMHPFEPGVLDFGQAFVGRRRLELAKGAHL